MARRPTKPAVPAPDAAPEVTAEPPPVSAAQLEQSAQTTPTQKGANRSLTLAVGAVLGMGAAALGYGAALYYPLNVQQTAPADNGQLTALTARLDALDLGAIESRLAALESAPAVDIAPLQDQITALSAKVAVIPAGDDLRAQVQDLAAKVAQSDPAPAIKAAIDAEMAAVRQAAQDMATAVTEAAQKAEASAALTQLRAALDTGGPYLAAAEILSLPQVLAQNASAGIPSLIQLRDGFADAARAGLDAALRADMGQTWGERVGNFLKTQTGARSLTPRDGSDPDAILSRVEAGLRSADLPTALREFDTLPDAAKAAMQVWGDQLRLRADALAAIAALSEKGM